MKKNITIEILLNQALPVPSDDVPVQTLLEFKRKRFDELLHFRHAMEELYLKISKSGSRMEEINHAVDTIDLSLREIKKVMDEGQLQSNLSTLISNITVKDIATGFLTGAALFDRYDLPLLGGFIGATIGAVVPSLKIKEIVSSFQPKEIPQPYKDYAYLYYLQHEFSE